MSMARFCVQPPAVLVATVLFLGTGCSESPRQTAAAGGLLPDTRTAPPASTWVDATIPEGTPVRVILAGRVSSASNRPGDRFRAHLTEAVVVGGVTVLPRDSLFEGVVSQATAAGAGGRDQPGSLVLDFKMVYTPAGAGAPVGARLEKAPELSGGKTVALGSSAGGETTGPTLVAGSPGEDLVLEADTLLMIVLEEPLTIKVRKP